MNCDRIWAPHIVGLAAREKDEPYSTLMKFRPAWKAVTLLECNCNMDALQWAAIYAQASQEV